jgi:hypothetical protein
MAECTEDSVEQVLTAKLAGTERVSNARKHQARVADRTQVDEQHGVRKAADECLGNGHGEARLATPARTGQCQQAPSARRSMSHA